MTKNKTESIKEYYNYMAPVRDRWKFRARHYHFLIQDFFRFIIPENSSVIEIGSGTGDLLNSVNPSKGLGIDIAENLSAIASQKYPHLKFVSQDAQKPKLQGEFDYVILSDVIGNLEDVQKCFEGLHQVTNEKTRVIVTSHNHLWEWMIKLLEFLHLKMRQPEQNWLSKQDIKNLLYISRFEIVKQGRMILFPFYIPLISTIFNKYLARLPIIRWFCLTNYFIARPQPSPYSDKEYSVSVIIPARNEEGNIESAVTRIPKLGSKTEIIFIEGGSKDNTQAEIKRVIEKYKGKKDITFIDQGEGVGKGDAVRKGFAQATGDILMILDADLTVPPEDLPKFYQSIRTKQGEFVMGSRLVYPMEKEAMRFLNVLGNKFFSWSFSWILDQPIKDTLCGTKVIFKKDYETLAKNRSYFGDFDPFGDYDLIFGASKLNLKILEIPIYYHAREYGETNISRFRHGLLLLKMTLFAARKIKFK
jgi:ubiquinone/menaquinone biosynthesis C-methylase UbiE